MRHTFELEGDTPPVSLSIDPYCGTVREAPQWCNGRVELTVWDGDTDDDHAVEINLETGSVEAMRHVLQGALGMLDDLEKYHKETIADHATHAVSCAHCGVFVDSRSGGRTHGDGRGGLCLGDGSRVTRMSLQRRSGDAWWEDVELADVHAGDVVRPNPEWHEDDTRDMHVVEDAQPYFDDQHGIPNARLGVRYRREA